MVSECLGDVVFIALTAIPTSLSLHAKLGTKPFSFVRCALLHRKEVARRTQLRRTKRRKRERRLERCMVSPRILHDRYSEHIEDEPPFLDSSKASMPFTWQA